MRLKLSPAGLSPFVGVRGVDDTASGDELAAAGADARHRHGFAFDLGDALAQLFVGKGAVARSAEDEGLCGEGVGCDAGSGLMRVVGSVLRALGVGV